MMHQNRAILRCRPAILPAGILTLVFGLHGCSNLPFGGKGEDVVRGGYEPTDQVALLLPMEGPLRGVADAVRDGVRKAAGVDDAESKPKLASVDSGPPDRVTKTFGQAVGEGATYVIGPIDKPSVDALAAMGGLQVVTLALNEGTFVGRPTPNLFQFSLSPEAVAVEVANKAKALGFSSALMLYPDDGAGKRRADAFRAHWRRLGGTLVGESAFEAGAAAYPAKTQGLLARGDADFLFLAANADQAQIVYPRIRKDAADLPVIATSDVYSGDSDPVRDRALAGLYFVDMPWMLGVERRNDPLRRADVKTSASYLATPLGRRLYAMGIDAYRVAPRLAHLASRPGSTFAGQTGRLSLDAMGRVRRELVLGRFTESGPEAVAGMKKRARAAQTRSARAEPTNRG